MFAEFWKWLTKHAGPVGVVVTVIIAVATFILSSPNDAPPGTNRSVGNGASISAGGDVTMAGGDINITQGVSDETIQTIIAHFDATLSEKNDQLADKERLIADLRGSLETVQKISADGGPLAAQAQTLLTQMAQAQRPDELTDQLDDLIAAYEAGPIADLVKLYLGRGALAFYHDTTGALAAYTRAAGLDPKSMEAHNRIGQLQHRLGDLNAAQSTYETVLTLAKTAGHKTAQAAATGNLGILAYTRGDLVAAEGYYQKSLTLEKELGRKEGMASDYGNLGILAKTRGDLDAAEGYYQKALTLNEALGRKEGMANQYGNLGNLAATRGDLDAAEEYYQKSLTLNEELGYKEGMASVYGNLGVLAKTRGDIIAAREYWVQARDLFADIGMPHMVEKVQGGLDGLE